jgi:hypothetical protein
LITSINKLVKFFDETDDISRILSAPNMPTGSLTSSPGNPSLPDDTMDYESVFTTFTPTLVSPFGPTSDPGGFNNHPTSPFAQQTSPSASSNLGLERLALSESPQTTFTGPPSQGSRSPGFGDFDAAMANFNTGMPIETMIDVTSIHPTSDVSFVTEQTARLMRHYIDNLASWMDLSDSRNHFSTVAPKRALTSVPSYRVPISS